MRHSSRCLSSWSRGSHLTGSTTHSSVGPLIRTLSRTLPVALMTDHPRRPARTVERIPTSYARPELMAGLKHLLLVRWFGWLQA